MTKDKLTVILVEALKQAMASPAEQRLYKSGKLEGLFPSRSGANAEAAGRAVRDGLLEVVRTETKGKTTSEWVRLTPVGVAFLHEHESPIRAMEELRDVLQTTREGMPIWLAEMRRDLLALGTRLTDEVQRWTHRLEALSQRVEEGLRRAEMHRPHLPDGMATAPPWALEALAYLDQRKNGGAIGDCSLPELFAAIRRQHGDLSLTDFHDGLRRLNDWHAVQLKPFAGAPSELPEPEFALPAGAHVLYYVTR